MDKTALEELITEVYALAEARYPKNEGQAYFERLLIEATVEIMEHNAVDRTEWSTLCRHTFCDEACTIKRADFPNSYCDKTFEMCREVFYNIVHFGGMPKIPYEDQR
jgi:hypothetical protein